MDDRARNILLRIYNKEIAHSKATRRMMDGEKNPAIKRALREISILEGRHAALWEKVLGRKSGAEDKRAVNSEISKIMLMQKLLGTALAIKIVERIEFNIYSDLYAHGNDAGLSVNEKKSIGRIERDDLESMGPLETKIVQYDKILSNIKDVILGMNDGLVEVLAAVVGFAAALQQPELVILGGIIVAVSGTISMTVGAYLSTDSEKSIKARNGSLSTPKASAVYMGMFYIFGSIFPILPFALGAYGAEGIVLSVVLTCIALSVSSAIISVLSDTGITRRIVKTLILSIAAASVTIVLGTYARYVLHLVI